MGPRRGSVLSFALASIACAPVETPAVDASPGLDVASVDAPRFDPPPSGWRAGARLRLRTEVAPDGTSHAIGWYDTLLETSCSFVEDREGILHCMPFAPLAPGFSGPGCAIPAHLVTACATAPRFVAERVGDAASRVCDGLFVDEGRYTVFELSPSDGAEPYARGASGVCEPASYAVASRVFQGELASDRFVRGTVVEAPVTSRLDRRFVVGDDGSVEPRDLVDHGSGEVCWLDVPYGTRRCLPGRTAFANVIGWRRDGACTEPIAHGIWPSLCGPTAVVLDLGEPVPVLRGAGPEIPSPVFEVVLDACEVIDRPREVFVEIGPALTEIPYAEWADDVIGTGRLRMRVRRSEGAWLADAGWETDRGTACVRRRFTDGIERCVDTMAGPVGRFADATCTEPLRSGGLFALREEPACRFGDPGTIAEVWSVRAASGPEYALEGDACVEVAASGAGYVVRDVPVTFDDAYARLETR